MVQVFVTPPRVITGEGSAAELGKEALALGARRALIVTDKTIREKTSAIVDALARLKEVELTAEVFDEVEPDPLIPTVMRCADLARRLDVQVIIGIGGGSSMDCAKGAAVVLGNEAPLDTMFGLNNVPKPSLPTILLPTTGGTGSEVSTSCVLTELRPDGMHFKKSIVSPMVVARTAIVDPLLTVTSPPFLTAATGMDALTHAIETYVSNAAQPMTDALALQAMKLIGKSLRRAVANGKDLEARRNMAYGSMMAGLAFSNGHLGLVHAFAMVMGSHFGTPHGVANALMLPYVMEFNEMAHVTRFAQIAEALGERTDGLSEREAAHLATVAVFRMIADLGLPSRLRDVNIPDEAIPTLAEAAFGNARLRGFNPRTATLQDMIGILERATGR